MPFIISLILAIFPNVLESNLILFAAGLSAINEPSPHVASCAQKINSLPECVQSNVLAASLSNSSNLKPTAVKYR